MTVDALWCLHRLAAVEAMHATAARSGPLPRETTARIYGQHLVEAYMTEPVTRTDPRSIEAMLGIGIHVQWWTGDALATLLPAITADFVDIARELYRPPPS